MTLLQACVAIKVHAEKNCACDDDNLCRSFIIRIMREALEAAGKV